MEYEKIEKLEQAQAAVPQLAEKEKYREIIAMLTPLCAELSREEPTFDNQMILFCLGESYYHLGDYQTALKYLKQSAVCDACRADATAMIATIHKDCDELDLAEENYKKSIELFYECDFMLYSAENVLFMYALVLCIQWGKGKPLPKLALHLLKEVLSQNSFYADAYQNAAVCLEEFGEKRLAKEFKAAIKPAKKEKLKEQDYRQLMTSLAQYLRDDSFPDMAFELVFYAEASDDAEIARRKQAPCFKDIKSALQKLWGGKIPADCIQLTNRFGVDDQLLIRAETNFETKKQFISIETSINTDDGNTLMRYETEDIKEILAICESYFYYRIIPSKYKFESADLMAEKASAHILPHLETKVFAPFAEKTAKPVNKITLTERECTRFESKIGGEPYMPQGLPYPKTKVGTPLRLLAQINFAEMPPLPDFPTEGILQFFIVESEEDGCVYGCDDDNRTVQNTFRVIYHEKIDETAIQQEIPKDCDNYDFSPIKPTACYGMDFEDDVMPMSICDYRFNESFMPIYNSVFGDKKKDYFKLPDSICEILYDVYYVEAEGHKIGGYPMFTQTDPREYGDFTDKDVLLLQITSEEVGESEIMWGDCGVANFFISREDLVNKNFNNVLYTWDCS